MDSICHILYNIFHSINMLNFALVVHNISVTFCHWDHLIITSPPCILGMLSECGAECRHVQHQRGRRRHQGRHQHQAQRRGGGGGRVCTQGSAGETLPSGTNSRAPNKPSLSLKLYINHGEGQQG